MHVPQYRGSRSFWEGGKDQQTHPLNMMGPTSLPLWSPMNSSAPGLHFLLAWKIFLYFKPSCSSLPCPWAQSQGRSMLDSTRDILRGLRDPLLWPWQISQSMVLVRVITWETVTHGFSCNSSTPASAMEPGSQDNGSRRSKDRVAHIRRCGRFRSSLVSELQKVADAASDSAWNGERCRYWLSGGRV